MDIQSALEVMERSLAKSGSHRSASLNDIKKSILLATSMVLCKLCMSEQVTLLKECILKLCKGVISIVQKHMMTCNDAEYKSQENPLCSFF